MQVGTVGVTMVKALQEVLNFITMITANAATAETDGGDDDILMV